MNRDFTILRKPLLTEKSYLQGQVQNAYSFVVDRSATKTQIKENIERLFNVKVKAIKTMSMQDKQKKVGKYVGIKKGQKKAIVTLFPEYTLDFFGETEVDAKEEKKKEKETKEAEKKSKEKETKASDKKEKEVTNEAKENVKEAKAIATEKKEGEVKDGN